MRHDSERSAPLPDNDDIRASIVLETIAKGPVADEEDRRLLGLTEPGHYAPMQDLEILNEVIRAAMYSAKQRRRSYAEAVEKYCNGDVDMIDIAKRFMARMSGKLAPHQQECATLIRQLANVPPDDQEVYPDERWRRAIHEALLTELEKQRLDAAVETCMVSWTSGLIPPEHVAAHREQHARAAVIYGRADEMLRITSRAVCRMASMRRLSVKPMHMLAMRDQFQQRLEHGNWTMERTPADMAKNIISMIGLERLEEAVNRPESENPKDGLIASYCEEIHENLPRSR